MTITITLKGLTFSSNNIGTIADVLLNYYKIPAPVVYQLAGEAAVFTDLSAERPYSDDDTLYFRARFERQEA